MKNYLLIALTFLVMLSCNKTPKNEAVTVKNIQELNKAIADAKPGIDIVLKNGVWENVEIKFYGEGTEAKPITLRAENSGEVFIEGVSSLHLGGSHLVVDGLYFRNGYSPSKSVIAYQIGKDSTAFHSKVLNCVIEDFTKPNRITNDRWIDFFGQHNTLDHCYLAGKSNDGETLRVFQSGNKHTKNYHQITNNYFGPRPRKGGPRAETIRVGDSRSSMTPGFVNIANNYFEACNGEVEIISDKTNFNTFKNNIFYKCEGSLVLRHSNFATVDGNIFIGDDDSNFYGGIRVINTGHWITNNYFYKINGASFRSPLAVMNGIPKSPLNRYKQVTDAVVAYNTWVDSKSPFQIGVGQNIKSADVLPSSEIRSAPPIRTIIANNLVYNYQSDDAIVVNHDQIKGVKFHNNLLDNNNSEYTDFNAFTHQSIKMTQVNDWLFVPEKGQFELMNSVYNGFNFDKIKQDIFGNLRAQNNIVGAINGTEKASKYNINKKKYGPSWFSAEKEVSVPTIFEVSATAGALSEKIAQAKSGDIIELTDAQYTIASSLQIDKNITIRTKRKNNVKLVFTGEKDTPLFSMNPKGTINLEGITLKGQKTQLAFASLKENMASAYNLNIKNTVIEDFNYVLKAYKGSFADSINVSNSTIQNCKNGFVLAADEKGDYNAEMVTFKKNNFKNVQKNVIHFYRGGYDESTIGGFLTLSGNTFIACGKKEKNGVLIKTRGIINVLISDNTFRNNPVRLVALLWGIKNNHHKNNNIMNSGKIKVEEQQKLDLLY